MTILQALNRYYDRKSELGELPLYGYSRENISFAIVLSPDGEAIDVQSLLVTASSGRPRPRLISVPRPVKRTSGIAANFLWDKTAYAIGVSSPDRKVERIAREHAAFRELHADLLADSEDEGLIAVRGFLATWDPSQFRSPPFSEEMLDTNLVFRLEKDGIRRFVHERPAAQKMVLERESRNGGRIITCLVTGEEAPVARLHPSIKGVHGAQSSGASIVSFNQDAFSSFGKSQGDNAPVSDRAAFGYVAALNSLLERDSKNHLMIGDASAVFWAEAIGGDENQSTAAEQLFAILASPPTDEQEAAKVRDVLEAITQGRPIAEAAPNVQEDTRFHVLGLSPNASRLSVRLWLTDTIGGLARRIGEHWQDLYIQPVPWRTPPAMWRLLYELAVQRKSENVPALLAGALARSILTGSRYPQRLLAAVIMRIRAEQGDVTGLRAAICKACISRDYRLGILKEGVPVGLDIDETNPAYRLGRLFAVLESVQRAGLGNVGATIRDRYFGAASATPASVFPALLRNSKNHLKSIRTKQGEGLAGWFDKQIEEIIAGLTDTTFPRSLRLEDQGRFAIGYYQQREALHHSKSATTTAASDSLDSEQHHNED